MLRHCGLDTSGRDIFSLRKQDAGWREIIHVPKGAWAELNLLT